MFYTAERMSVEHSRVSAHRFDLGSMQLYSTKIWIGGAYVAVDFRERIQQVDKFPLSTSARDCVQLQRVDEGIWRNTQEAVQ